MIGAFVTGSQTEVHKMRMLKEALKFLFKISIFSFIIFGVIFYIKTPKYNLKLLSYHYKAQFVTSINQDKKFIFITSNNGIQKKVNVNYLIKSPYILNIKYQTIKSLKHYLLLSFVIPLLFPLFFWFQGRKKGVKKTLRGATKVSQSILIKLVKKYNDKALKRRRFYILEIIRKIKCFILKQEYKKPSYKPYKIANALEYPATTENQHTFITGGSGTGKTVLLSGIIDQIKQNGDIAIIYDKMGSFIPYFYNEEKDIILNPFDKRSKNWSIFNEIRKGKEESDLRTIASSIIAKNKMGDNFWIEQAQNLFIAICLELIKLDKKDNSILADYILRKDFKELKELLKHSDVRQMFESDEQIKMTQSIRSTLASNTHFLKILKEREEPQEELFSIRKFIEEGMREEHQNNTNKIEVKRGIVNDNNINRGKNKNKKEQEEIKDKFLFLSSRSDVHETLQPLLTCQLDIAINTLLSLKKQNDKNIWIIIDELPSINQIPMLDSGLAQARQFGGRFILSMQLISQLEDIYGDRKSNTMSGNCKTRIIFASPDVKTSRWSSESLGRRETDEIKESMTFGANEIRDGVGLTSNVKIEELVMPSEIQSLPNLSFYIKLPFHFPISKIKIKPKKRDVIAEGFLEEEFDEKSSSLSELKGQDTEANTVKTNLNNKEDINTIQIQKKGDVGDNLNSIKDIKDTQLKTQREESNLNSYATNKDAEDNNIQLPKQDARIDSINNANNEDDNSDIITNNIQENDTLKDTKTNITKEDIVNKRLIRKRKLNKND